MWTISFTKRDLMKTEYLQRREIMEKYSVRKPVIQRPTMHKKCLERWMKQGCLIPSELVPKCPVCGGRMEMNLRCDNYFVEDEAWHEAADRYADFLKQNRNKKVVLLELGVGFNTPIIIRFPFEKMVRENSSYSLIRLNMDEAVVPESFGKRAIGIEGDMERAITDIRGQVL